jgi:hypothetical protein
MKGGTASGACVPGAVRQPNVEAIAMSTRDQSQPWARTKTSVSKRRGPGTGETEPKGSFDVVGKNFHDFADKLGV